MHPGSDSNQAPAPVVSLARWRARRALRRFRALPAALRTPARTRPVIDAMLAYAYEGQPAAGQLGWAGGREVCRRLQECLPPAGPGDRGLMPWLHEHLLPEALQPGDALVALLDDCLRSA